MGLPRGLKGTTCTVCGIGTVKTQDALTCSPECGVELKRRSVAPQPIELHIPLSKFRVPVRQEAEASIARAELAELIEEAKQGARKYAPIKRPKTASNLMLELAIPDLHLGKLAWSKETGWENYDFQIAERCYRDALATLLDRTGHHKFDSILLVVGNDLFNSDTLMRTTTSGTVVTTDVRIQRTFQKGRQLMVETIERLREIAPVKVVMIPGNHDRLAVWHLGESLECWFHNCSDVTVDNTPLPRKYVVYGKTLIGLTHGDQVKRERLPMVMAVEASQQFAACPHREWHTGHLHQTRVQEFSGVRVRILSSLSAADDYHATNGYVGNERCAEAFVWDEKAGLVGTAIYTIPEEQV